MRWARAAVALAVVGLLATAQAQAAVDRSPPANPHLGPLGSATMHGDAESSDTTPLPGPGAAVRARFVELGAACPTILVGGDGIPQALCTAVVDRAPTVFLLNPATGDPVAELRLRRGGLLGGVYAYLDDRNRMVTADGSGDLLWVAHDGARLFVERRLPIAAAVTGHCGKPGCDTFASATPDWAGRIWFATEHAVVGTADPRTGAVRATALPVGESVQNSLSSAPGGVAVATDRALYLLTAGPDGTPRVRWRRAYDRGPARKPGQLSWGTGATPTFFGPASGSEYLAITDNAAPREHLLVYRAASGTPVCSVPVFAPGASGTENSPIGVGRSVFVASTYGYPYPAGAIGPSVPAAGPVAGGLARIDVTAAGCATTWTSDVKSAAVPRLSLADGKLYTVVRRTRLPGGQSTPLDDYFYTVLDAATGRLDAQAYLGTGAPFDTLQMVGSIAAGRVQYQGAVSGLFRIAPQ
ncbi:MAG: hypothetical protein HOQ24_06505 [Mycobacteriaceae bacterium]|nr:hypothetical protein [Mycobacteriaceae bacterium]